MELTRAQMDAIFTALNTSLNKGLGTAWKGYERWSNSITSSTAGEKYPMALVTGGMRKWIGDRVINKLSGNALTVLNEDYEHTEAVSLNDIKDDQVGYYSVLFESMGVDSENLWPRLATEALLAPGKWADNVNFYSATRKLGKATYNNIVNDALSLTSYETAREQMMAFTDTTGQNPLALVPDMIIVGQQLESTAKKLFKSSLIVDSGVAVDNPHKDEVEVQVNPWLTGTHAAKWFLVCTTRGIKPISVQKREVGPLNRWDQPHDSCVKDHNEAHYGLHYRGAAAGVAPFLVIGGNLG